MEETKICNKCNRELTIDKFRLVKGQFHNPYYLGQCKECEYKSQRKHLEERNRITFSDHLELLIDFQYKKIKPERILATVYKGNIIKNLIMDCQSYTKYRPNETAGGIFVSWRRKEELPTGA